MIIVVGSWQSANFHQLQMAQGADKMDVLMGNSDASVTIVLRHEGHTLGNALRYMLIKNPQVKFAGYTVPHPLIPEMHLRVATQGTPAIDVTAAAAQQLIDVCNHMETVFNRACDDYRSAQ